jgi:adenylate kinase
MSTANHNSGAAWFEGPTARCEAPASNPAPYRFVLLGAPGVGKGAQADVLHQRLGACHLSTGDVFRTNCGKGGSELSPAMKEALQYMRRGGLAPDSTVWEMVHERSGCLHCEEGFILDGFPRTLGQTESLKHLVQEEGIALTAVVNCELAASEIVARLSGRRTREKCKTVFPVPEPPSQFGSACDRCGGDLFQREDNRAESIAVRLEACERSTAPLIDFYRNLGLLVTVGAGGSTGEIYQSTLATLEARSAA